MAAKFIPASTLASVEPDSRCCECGADPIDSKNDDLWTNWEDDIIYCPVCAAFGPEE